MQIHRFLILAPLSFLFLACSSQPSRVEERPVSVVVEAESYQAETGGTLAKRSGRPGTSGNVSVSGWDSAGHAIEWQVEVPRSGQYGVALRYAGGRSWPVYRQMSIDGTQLPSAYARIALAPTGGFGTEAAQWKQLIVVNGDGKTAWFQLSAGKHVIRMKNLGGDGPNGSGNLDSFVLFQPGAESSPGLAASAIPAVGATQPAQGGAVSRPLAPVKEHPSLKPAQLAALGYLREWKLHLPVAGAGKEWAAEITQPELGGMSSIPWFYVDAKGDSVVFRANAGGVRTSNNTRFARSELLEMDAVYANGAYQRYERKGWNLSDDIERSMFIRQTITAVPLQKPQVVVGQIHNAKDDVLMVRFEGTSPGKRSAVGELQIRLNNAKDKYVLDPTYVIGTPFTVDVRAKAGRITVLYNGKPTSVTNIPVTIDTRDCYYKAGMYVQSSDRNTSTYKNGFLDEDPNEYGEVKIHELRLSRQ